MKTEAPAEGPAPRTPVTTRRSRSGTCAIEEFLRRLLVEAGLTESQSSEQRGFYLAAEDRDEMSVHFCAGEYAGAAGRPQPARRYESALLKLCDTLAQNGFTLTLFMSPRSIVLFVRTDEIGRARAARFLDDRDDSAAS